MIKLTFCLVRRPELSRAEFQRYWREIHAPLVASVQAALRIRRYVQTHSLPQDASEGLRALRGGPFGYDGVAQLWWESLEVMAGLSEDPAAIEAGRLLLEDERRFIDLSRSPLWWGEEHEIVAL
ncbi:MAG: EthD domain-containing protein [Caulobacteraceae bacterium]|nr:EthD domain-containing protein [Caulobacteraceae bacterium]